MIIQSTQKRDVNVNISFERKLKSQDRKENLYKVFGCFINSSLSWNKHISSTCSQISKNTGIISKLCYVLSFQQLKEMYYALIYPYISYAIVSTIWTSLIMQAQGLLLQQMTRKSSYKPMFAEFNPHCLLAKLTSTRSTGIT